jgi:hypothetical protein
MLGTRVHRPIRIVYRDALSGKPDVRSRLAWRLSHRWRLKCIRPVHHYTTSQAASCTRLVLTGYIMIRRGFCGATMLLRYPVRTSVRAPLKRISRRIPCNSFSTGHKECAVQRILLFKKELAIIPNYICILLLCPIYTTSQICLRRSYIYVRYLVTPSVSGLYTDNDRLINGLETVGWAAQPHSASGRGGGGHMNWKWFGRKWL